MCLCALLAAVDVRRQRWWCRSSTWQLSSVVWCRCCRWSSVSWIALNYDCYLISSYVARRPFLYVDGASCEHAWSCGWWHSEDRVLCPSQITDVASCCYLHILFLWQPVVDWRVGCRCFTLNSCHSRCSYCLCTCLCVSVCGRCFVVSKPNSRIVLFICKFWWSSWSIWDHTNLYYVVWHFCICHGFVDQCCIVEFKQTKCTRTHTFNCHLYTYTSTLLPLNKPHFQCTNMIVFLNLI